MLYSKSFVFGVLDVVLGFGLFALFHANCFIAGALVKACFGICRILWLTTVSGVTFCRSLDNSSTPIVCKFLNFSNRFFIISECNAKPCHLLGIRKNTFSNYLSALYGVKWLQGSGGEVVTSPLLNRKVGCSRPTMMRGRCLRMRLHYPDQKNDLINCI